MKRAWLLGAFTFLLSCAPQSARVDPKQLVMEAQAREYLRLCRQGVLSYHAIYAFEQHALPRELDGQTCESGRLREYSVLASKGGTIKGSVIRSDGTRLSGYTIEVTGLDGKSYTYVDRGVTAAAAEQAGTFDTDPAAPETDESGDLDAGVSVER